MIKNMEIDLATNPSNQLSIKDFFINKISKIQSKENIKNQEKSHSKIDIKSKKIFKRNGNSLNENKKTNKTNKKIKKKRGKINDRKYLSNTEMKKIFNYINSIDYYHLDPIINKFSPLKTISTNLIWYLVNLFYFNNDLYFKKENYSDDFYIELQKLYENNIKDTKISYSLINQIIENNQLINSPSFLKNFKNIKIFDKFNLIEDIKFINNFNKLKKDNFNLNCYDWKKNNINNGIDNLLNEIKNIKEKIKNNFINFEIENKLSVEKESKFLINPNNNDEYEDVYKLLDVEKIFIDLMERKKNVKNFDFNDLSNEEYYCHICNNAEHNSKNEIIFCSFCNISVHIKCYGLNVIPKEDDWICQVCLEFGDWGRYLPCALCPTRGGLLKKTTLKIDSNFFEKKNNLYHNYLLKCRTSDNNINSKLLQEQIKKRLILNTENETDLNYNYIKDEEYIIAMQKEPVSKKVWVHLTCCFWSPQMYINGKNNNEILGIMNIDKKRFLNICIICKQYNGATLKCNNRICFKYFHIECARRNDYYLELFNTEGKNFNIYCHTHKPFQLKKVITLRERKIKEDIDKFSNNLLRFLKEKNLVDLKSFKFTNIKNEKKEKRLEIEELVNHLNPEQIFFLNRIKDYVFKQPDNCFKIKLKDNKIIETKEPKKNFLIQSIGKIYDVFGKYAEDYNFKFNIIYKFYINIIKTLKVLDMNQNNLENFNHKNNIVLLDQENVQKDEQLEENLMELGENHCVCNRPWNGELMVECENCNLWFHPECQNLNDNDLNKENLIFKCSKCSEKMILE